VRGVRDTWSGSVSGTREAKFYEMTSTQQKPQDEKEILASQKTIDEILDKISVSGYSSLTDNEKRLLLDASKKIHPDKGAE